jgi:hypothetical protein
MDLTSDFDISAAQALAIRAAGADLRAAEAQHASDETALATASGVLEGAEREVERLTGEENAWHQRTARRLEEWIANGRKGPQPTATADAKAALALSSARANVAAAQGAVQRFTAATQASARAVEGGRQRLQALILAEHQQHIDALLRQIATKRAEIDELRALAGAPLYAREMQGLQEFGGIVSARQVEALNRPAEPLLDIASLFAGRRFVVSFEQPLSAAREPLEEALAYWRERQAQLAAIAGQLIETPQDVAA